MTRTTIIAALSALAVAGATASLATAGSAGKHSDRLSYPNVNTIVLDNTQGHVQISAGHSSGVTVERTTQTLLTKATSSANISGGVLHLDSRCYGTVCQVDFVINTPAGVRLQLTEKNADVSIDGSPGNLAVTNTGEGHVTLDLVKAPRRVQASTHHGAITITVPHGRYAVLANATDGDKTVTGVEIDQKAAHSIRAVAHSGDITISGR